MDGYDVLKRWRGSRINGIGWDRCDGYDGSDRWLNGIGRSGWDGMEWMGWDGYDVSDIWLDLMDGMNGTSHHKCKPDFKAVVNLQASSVDQHVVLGHEILWFMTLIMTDTDFTKRIFRKYSCGRSVDARRMNE